MALKEILQQWDRAVKAHTAGCCEEALDIYRNIEDISARMYFNMACAHIKEDQLTEAIQCLTSAVNKDVHLAIAFFFRGVLRMKTGQFSEAKRDLHETLTLFRDNQVINYKQLGLQYKLHLSQVLYNVAHVELHEGDLTAAEDTLYQALRDADLGHRKLIQEMLDLLQDGKVDSIKPLFPSTENVFTPPKVVTTNLEKRKYIPKAKVISAANIADVEAKFDGERRVREMRRFSELSPAVKPPKSPLLAVKNLLNKGTKSPVPGIRLNKSTGDLQALAEKYDQRTVPRQERLTSLPSEQVLATTENNDKLNLNTPVSNKQRPSIGSVFGNNLTAVSHALSTSCDVLTSLVIPEVHVMDLSASGDADFIDDENSRNSCLNQSRLTDKTHTEVSEKCDDVTITDNFNNKLKDTKEVNEKISKSGVENASPQRRPPPPSYPPPPLPSKIVITV